MTVQLIKYEMEVPKELKEVIDLLDAIIAKVIAKAPLADYSAILPQLMTAIDGIQGISEEIKSQYRDEAAGYLVHKLLGSLLPVKSEAPEAPAAE